MSLDGYIARNDDNIDFLSLVEEENQDYGYCDFLKSIDTVIMGRKTYDKVLSFGIEFPHADKETYIITRTSRPSIGSVQFYTGSLKELVKQLKNKPGKNIYVDGGAEIVQALLKEELIDEIVISIIPVLLGSGISLFKNGCNELKLKLKSTRSYNKGLVQLHYQKL